MTQLVSLTQQNRQIATPRAAKQRHWPPLVAQMSQVQKLVHLAMRKDDVDEEDLRRELLLDRRRIYEDELTEQARRVGCGGQRGRIGEGPVLAELNEMCVQDAGSIVNTYNYDLALEIQRIGAETPTANRYVYAFRLNAWNNRRLQWKSAQVALYTETSTRSKAQQDFYRYNDLTGYAVLKPTEAVCPVCQGWVARGEVPLRVAQNHPPPYHVGCPHGWATYPGQVPPRECPRLWMGQ